MTMPRVRILHETNPEKYFPALLLLAKEREIELVGTHRSSVFKEWLRSWIRDRAPFFVRSRRAVGDLFFRLTCWRLSGETIVIGFAPWDWRILFYSHLARRNRIIYHTSWHDWRPGQTPRRPWPFIASAIRTRWVKFLTSDNASIVAVTPTVATAVSTATGKDATVIPHAVPAEFFSAGESRKPKETDTRLRLLFVGEVSEKKGIGKLLEMLPRLSDAGCELTVVGNGPLASEVRNHADGLNFLGPIYDRAKLAAVMADHDVLVLLSQRTKSWEELFGIVIVEAIAAGMCVVSSDHIGPKGILEAVDGVGLVSEHGSEAETLLKRLASDTKALESMRTKQASAASSFEISKIVRQWSSVIQVS